MLTNIFQILFIILFPGLILFLETKFKIIQWLSAIVVCYLVGIIVGNLPFIHLSYNVIEEVSKISVSLAIPLLLFNSNIPEWIKYAGKTLISYVLSIVAVMVSSYLVFLFFNNKIENAWQISGMLIGVYTGGTPNMSAIGIALDTPGEVFVILNSADVFLGAIYFVFLITLARPVLGWFLPEFNEKSQKPGNYLHNEITNIKKSRLIINILIALVLGMIILGIAAWVSIMIKGEIAGPWVILVMTTLGIGFSFVSVIQRMKGSYETAHYLLLVFSLAIGMLADVQALVNQTSSLATYCAMVMFGAVLLHYLLAFLFRIDRDTVIITSTAAIYGPAFAGPVANAIKNKKVIVSGITMGLLGYAIGNYLGIGMAILLE